jgi:hypothetical protein
MAAAKQKGNLANASVPASQVVLGDEAGTLPSVQVAAPAPVRKLDTIVLRNLGARYKGLFDRYASERIPTEQKWLKNLRQYIGVYDPDIDRLLPPNRSRAYPKMTRVKCISMLSRLMNLMFPGNETNWELTASTSPEMDPLQVAKAVKDKMTELQAAGEQVALSQDLIDEAVRDLAEKSAESLTAVIEDQLNELGGDQTVDWISLNRKVIDSGIKYGVGVLEGPFVRKVQQSGWMMQGEDSEDAQGNPVPAGFQPVTRDVFKPQYDFLPVWDFYPDMSSRTLPGEGYFVRKILGRSALRKLADRPDFFGSQIKAVISQLAAGNYRQKSWETELRTMGLASNTESTTAQASGREKYEVIIWKGPVSGQMLRDAGATVPDKMVTEDVFAELWMIDNWIIKAEINAWRLLGVDMATAHIFSFDEDDTSPISQGLPGIVRDSQLSICAATRMTLDNASVVCGPQFEINTALMRTDQDLTAIEAYKNWYRDDDGPSSQFPAIRRIEIDGHLPDLQGLVKMFMDFAEMETFIGPQTGGDMTQMPSEPMRTAAGASMARGDAALPFKDIVRNYDSFTQSVIWSMVGFNKKFNPDLAPPGDYDVIPRGATSLIAKEVRGSQIDQLSQTLTPDEWDHINKRKFLRAKMAARDLTSMMVSEEEAAASSAARGQAAAAQADQQKALLDAQVHKTAAEAFKSTTQGQKNVSTAEGQSVKTALHMIDSGDKPGEQGTSNPPSAAAA